MPDNDPTYSPGRAVSERTNMELALTSQTMRAMRVFLAGVEFDSVRALGAPVVLAAAIDDFDLDEDPEPFTLGRVLTRWEKFKQTLRSSLGGYRLPDEYLDQVTDRLGRNPIPDEAYFSAKEVLSAGIEKRWSRRTVVEALSLAMSMTTGSTRRTADPEEPLQPGGTNWEAQARRLARTEATSAYGFDSIQRMKLAEVPMKQWVAVGDKKTRLSHAKASGQTVPTSEPFLVGDSVMMYPGDPAGSVGETANCRCVTVAVR